MSNIHFYKDLVSLNIPVPEIFGQRRFSEVPADWHVIISDVKNSTAAVTEGRHNDVNLVAAGSLIAALNIAGAKEVEIPFFFSGDGGTLLVPEEILDDVLNGLTLHNLNSIKNLGLQLHIGNISLKEIQAAGHFIKIAKTQFAEGLNKAITIGDGLRFAEKQIKNTTGSKNQQVKESDELNLTGLECRWDKIKPITEENEIVCYLIETQGADKQMEVYRDVLLKIDEIYGTIEKRNPLSLERLKLLLNFQKIRKEMMAKFGKLKLSYFTIAYIKTFFGRLLFKYHSSGKRYLNQLIANADTLIIDGRINTIISGKMDKRIKLIEYLSEEEKKGSLIYGHHISKESIMTCYIENRNTKHIHFVDGSDGGYTEAAKELKAKLKLQGVEAG